LDILSSFSSFSSSLRLILVSWCNARTASRLNEFLLIKQTTWIFNRSYLSITWSVCSKENQISSYFFLKIQILLECLEIGSGSFVKVSGATSCINTKMTLMKNIKKFTLRISGASCSTVSKCLFFWIDRKFSRKINAHSLFLTYKNNWLIWNCHRRNLLIINSWFWGTKYSEQEFMLDFCCERKKKNINSYMIFIRGGCWLEKSILGCRQ